MIEAEEKQHMVQSRKKTVVLWLLVYSKVYK